MVEEKKETNYELIEVPTQMGLAIKTPEGKVINEAELLVELANKVEQVRKALE